MIRDQVPASSGLLSRKLFGKQCQAASAGRAVDGGQYTSSYPREFKADSGESIYRRSVYTFWKRGMPPPQMTILNAPSREECIARRERTNTPLQALLLLNEVEYLKAARQLAVSVLGEGGSKPDALVDAIYETVTSQQLDDKGRAAFVQLFADLQSLYQKSPELAAELCGDVELPKAVSREDLAAATMLASTVYNLDITKTRQ